MADHTEDNDPFEEDIVFDQAGLLGGKMPRSRQQSTVGFLPTFMLFIRTVFLCIAFIGLGLCVSVSGGPLIKLEIGVGISVDTAFHTFTARSVGTLFGGILGSLLFEVYNRQFLMFVSLVWVAVCVTVMPFTVATALWWTFATTAALGMGLGFLFTGGNVLCLDLWGRAGGASLQALHFSFAVGAFIAPLAIHPFFVGLHPFEIQSNQSLMETTAMTEAPHIPRFVRSLQDDVYNASYSGEQSLGNLTNEKIKLLTLPKGTTEDTILVVNSTSDHLLTSLENENDTSVTVEPDYTLPETTTSARAASTKPPMKKPNFTDGNALHPDNDTKWKRPSSRDQGKTKVNPPKPQQEPSKNQTLEISVPTAASVEAEQSIEGSGDNDATSSEVHITMMPEQVEEAVQTENQPVVNETTVETEDSSLVKLPTVLPTTTTTPKPTAVEITSITTTAATSTTTAPTTTTTATTTTTTTTTTPATTVVTTHMPETTEDPNLPLVPYPKEVAEQEDHEDHFREDLEEDIETPENVDDENMDDDSEEEPEAQGLQEALSDEPISEESYEDEQNKSGISSVMHSQKPGTYSIGSDENNKFLDDMAQRFKDYGVTKVHLAYICIGIFIILNALISVVILCHNPREPRSKQDDGSMGEINKSRVLVFMVIFSVFMFMAESLQGAVHHLLATTDTGTGLDVIQNTGIDGQALFWGLVCLVRFLCILVSGCLKLKPGKLLTISILFAAMGSVFLAIGSYGKDDFLWSGIIFMALGLAPILPTSLLWMAQYMRVTHRMCALMIILASFGNSLTHSLLTKVVGNSHVYPFILVTVSFVSLFCLLLSMCVIYTARRSRTLGVPAGYQLANQHEEEDSIELTPSGSAVFTPSDPPVRENGEAGQSLLID
ncbi:uncharacterized protein LOC119577897 [Penaeus monodon]|uniref:uncharacterized protein LOC119577897 n=1 Tax=Penaeus monodon TaxID=6687 RepID=UPI0018A6EE72|nr:uncharacterized protein LOC119577897 [Penaeus monodon]